MRIDPKLIIAFAVIAQESSFTRAAQRLRVAQPWLSARLAKLEDLLGFRVLDRTTRSVALTDAGRALLPLAEKMMRLAQEADRLSLELGRHERRILRIGAAPYTKVIRHRHELLNDFAITRPDISLELETSWSLPLLAKLDGGEIDLSFMMGTIDGERYERIVMAHYGVALTVARMHPWASEPFLRADALAGVCVQVFNRSLNPGLWDMLYAPLVAVGCRFLSMPEMAEGAPTQMRSNDDIGAFFDFGPDDPGGAGVVRIPLRSSVAVPFQLLRSAGRGGETGDAFWRMAQSRQMCAVES